MSDLFSGSRKALAERFLSAAAFWYPALTFRASVIAETATILTPGVPPQVQPPPLLSTAGIRTSAGLHGKAGLRQHTTRCHAPRRTNYHTKPER